MLVATMGSSAAQTWQWQYTAHPGSGQSVPGESRVVLSRGQIATSYAPTANRAAAIDACRVALTDVQHVIVTGGSASSFFVVQLKPGRTAACRYSGHESVAALPGGDAAAMRRVADAINRALPAAPAPKPTLAPRRVARRVVAQTTPKPAPAVPPKPAPVTPAPTATPAVAIADWVESEGLFSFVRVRNGGKVRVTITGGDVRDCKNVEAGCGPLAHRFELDPFGTATIATLMSTTDRSLPSFRYSLTATDGRETITTSGSATKAAPVRAARMTPQQIRAAEAAAIRSVRAPVQAAQPPQQTSFTPPRLVKRGSSRLAIGQTGVAQVRLMIDPNGAPQQAEVVSTTNPRLVPAAIETAVSSTYAPATRNGQPVAGKYVATFSFNGEDPATSDIPVWWRSPSPPALSQPLPLPSASPEP
jgi:hypothetical protein